jgi:hypothetical protein
MVNIHFNTHMSEREFHLNKILNEMLEIFDYEEYYLVNRTETTRTVCDGDYYITFGVTDFYKPTRTYFIVHENEYIPEYKTYTSFKKFYDELL